MKKLAVVIGHWVKHFIRTPRVTARWALVTLLDKHPKTCWATLCSWAAHPYSLREFWDEMWHQHCWPEPYCGKCLKTGRTPLAWND